VSVDSRLRFQHDESTLTRRLKQCLASQALRYKIWTLIDLLSAADASKHAGAVEAERR
jgi:hypothetical protein